MSQPDPTRSAAPSRDQDVQIVLEALIGREPTENEWARVPSLAALGRIGRRLDVGAGMARIVMEAIEQGLLTVEATHAD